VSTPSYGSRLLCSAGVCRLHHARSHLVWGSDCSAPQRVASAPHPLVIAGYRGP
jgi:hypothetical protein